MCFDFYLLQQRRQGLVFGGRLILLFVFGRHVCDQLFQKCLSQVYITCLLIFFLFISFHPFSFFFFHIPLSSFIFRFNVSFPTSTVSLPPSNVLPRFSLLHPSLLCPPPLHVPSDWFLCPSNFSSNAARAAFHPPASGAASLGALLMRLRAGKPRKCQE